MTDDQFYYFLAVLGFGFGSIFWFIFFYFLFAWSPRK